MIVPNRHLKPMDVPAPGAELSVIARFAELFDPAVHWKPAWGAVYFERSRRMLAASLRDFAEGRPLSNDLTELRTCLALECTLLSQQAHDPTLRQDRYLRALVEKIRGMVAGGAAEGARSAYRTLD
jgi:hypothetical protein